MPLIEITRSGLVEECDDCGVGIEPEQDYAIWADEERQQELLICPCCLAKRLQRRNARLEAEG